MLQRTVEWAFNVILSKSCDTSNLISVASTQGIVHLRFYLKEYNVLGTMMHPSNVPVFNMMLSQLVTRSNLISSTSM